MIHLGFRHGCGPAFGHGSMGARDYTGRVSWWNCWPLRLTFFAEKRSDAG